MELKTKYQYTYFIYPYMIEEEKYERYLLGLLKNKKCYLKYFEKEKDYNMYHFFLPKVREYLFRNFEFTKEKIKKFKEFSDKMQARILSKYPCVTFEYQLGKDVQAKEGEENGIFFKVQKIEIICFNTGICFFCLKTNVEDSTHFSDVLNFNYKFKDSESELKKLKNYENIRLQTSDFSEVINLNNLMRQLIPNRKNSKKVNLDTDTFYTYAYTCIEQEYWDQDNTFDNLHNEFLKYMYLQKSNSNINLKQNYENIIDKWKFARMGITKTGITLFSSAFENDNYTKLPFIYENEYFYLYIWILHKKIYLNKISKLLDKIENNKKSRDEFVKFTQNIWIHEITNDDIGLEINKKLSEQLGIDKIYQEVKNKYDIMYKGLKIERNSKINKCIFVLFVISLICNIINLVGILLLK